MTCDFQTSAPRRFVRSASLLALVLSTPFPATAQSQCQELVASDFQAKDRFGFSVALDAGLAVVGAPGDDGAGTDAGSAYVIEGCSGFERFELHASDAVTKDRFGVAVATLGNRIVVGAPFHDHAGIDAGAVYVFDATTGQQLFELNASDAMPGDGFGGSLALRDGLLVVGAKLADGPWSDQGAAYVFDLRTGAELFKLTPSDPAQQTFFGWSVGVTSEHVVVGSRFQDGAYVFDASTGTELRKLTTSDPSATPYFGEQVAIAGHYAVVGDWADAEHGTFAGAAYVFDVTTGEQLHRLTAYDGGPDALFGESVAMDGDDVVVGARFAEAAYAFDVRSGAPLFRLSAGDGSSEEFGGSVAVADGQVLVGAALEDDHAPDAGAAYLYSIVTTIGTNYCGPANANSSGAPAVAFAFGSRAVAEGLFAVRATGMPRHQLGLFLTSQTTGFVPFAGGSQGNLCLSGEIGRFRSQLASSAASGTFAIAIDLADLPPAGHVVQPGETWHFQAWFRDVNPLPTSNFTDGVSVTFR